MFGYERQPKVFVNNTTTLNAYLLSSDDSEHQIPASDITSVKFTILKPTDLPDTPSVDADDGVVLADGRGQYIVDAAVNDVPGSYRAIATFVYAENGNSLIKSVPVMYDVEDMFKNSGVTPASPALDLSWRRFEDIFDSVDGGPWLRDMTLSHFDKDKMRVFIPDVMLEINATMPQSNYDETSFPYGANDGTAIFAYGLFMAGVRHLMVSYVEQPTPMNQQVAYHSREDYHRRWGEIYQIELERWKHLLVMFKARSFDLSGTSLLIGVKAGRLLPGSQRTRNVGRGFM